MQATTTRPKITVTADGAGVVSRVGSRLLADVADRRTLTGELAEALGGLRRRRARYEPGRVLVDLAVAVADGATTISEIAVLGDQAALFGSVASDSTGCCSTRSRTPRSRRWRRPVPGPGRWCGPSAPRLVGGRSHQRGSRPGCAGHRHRIDIDASIVVCHSEKEQAAATFKGTFGYHPLAAFCDNTTQALAGMLRRGNAGANTATDHIRVLDAALAQIPDHHRHGTPILFRTDTAGCTKAFIAHIRAQREQGVACEFSVGWAITDRERAAVGMVPKGWADAVDAEGGDRDGAGLAEITGLLPAATLADYPAGTPVIVRRERPHPGAQLDLMETRDGWRYTAFATDTRAGQLAFLDARHRAHARVEDRIRTAKDTGLDHFPSRTFAINQAWLAVVMLAVDLLAWTQHLLLHGELAKAEPKTLRYRLLHVAARITRGQRRTWVRIQRSWPWAHQLAAAFARLHALPVPTG